MVTDVKIDNVGGPRPQLGVASEATLQALLDATRGSGRSERDRSRLQENYDRSIRDTSQSQGLFKRAIVSGAASLYNFGKELAFGGDRASNFADAVFGSTSMVSKLSRYLEENIDTWRTLSSVGASFNNSIFDMIASAANSGMNLDDFANMVRDNSIAMSRLGKTTSQGARFIGEFSNDFRSGIGLQFFEMGYTIQDVNEGLIGFMMLERQRSADALASDRSQQEAAALYLLSLDKLTKVTGRQRKQIEDALAQQMQDAGIRSQINRLEGQARTNLQETLAFLDTELQGPLADGLKDLMDGVAQTDLGQALQSQVPGIGEFARQMFEGGATVDEVISQLGTRFGPQLSRLAGTFSKAQLDQMRMSGGVAGAIAEILDSSYQLNQIVGKDAEAALAEQKRREPLTAALGKFEQVIIDLRKQFVDAFFDIVNVPGGLVDAFSDLGDFLMSWIEPGADSLTGIAPSIRSTMDLLFGANGFVTRNVRAFTKYLREGGLQRAFDSVKEAFNSVKTWITEFISDVETEGFWPTIQARFINLIKEVKTQWQNIFSDTGDGTSWQDRIGNYIKDILYGKEVEVREGPELRLERQGGLIKTITEGFEKLFEPLASLIGLDTATGADSYLNQIMKRIGLDTATVADSYLDQIMKKMEDALLGKEVEVREGPELHLERQGGLIKTITKGFTKLFDSAFSDTGWATRFLNAAYEWLKLTLFGGTTAAGTQQTGLLDKAYNWLVDTLFGEKGKKGERTGGLLDKAYNWLVDTLFGEKGKKGERTGGLLDKAYNWLVDTLFGEKGKKGERTGGLLDKAYNWVVDTLFGEKGKKGERTGGLLDKAYNWVVDTLFGEKGKKGERTGGLLDKAIDYIMDTLFPADRPGMGMWDRIIDTIMDGLFGENIKNPFTDVETDTRPGQLKWFARIEKALNDWFGLSLLEAQTGGPSLYDQVTVKINDMFDGLKLTLEAGLIELLELLNTGFAGWFIDDERLAERRTMYEATTLGRSTDPADIERKNAEIQRLQSQLQQLQEPNIVTRRGTTYTAPLDHDRINSVKAQLEALGVRGLNQGTNGFENFGKGTLAMLHGAEAVVPRNTPAGELLQQYFNKANNENSATTIPTSSQTNQSDLSSKIDQLNTVMSRVAVLMEASVGVQTRTMQNIKGLSTDIIKGIPR